MGALSQLGAAALKVCEPTSLLLMIAGVTRRNYRNNLRVYYGSQCLNGRRAHAAANIQYEFLAKR